MSIPVSNLETIHRRWDAMAADQLRAEVERLTAENDSLRGDLNFAQSHSDGADFYFNLAQAERVRCEALLRTARRAGIDLRAPGVSLTREGCLSLTQAAA